ncbi:arylesterase [Sphingorhabdus arenilitoris]|uniref:Arylesterase n=1 Tax=Sphingorhabdus arenilitoris TaxID=1490041 RepID=A0ABV8RDW8_9SPHN
MISLRNLSLYGALLFLFQGLVACDAAPPPDQVKQTQQMASKQNAEPTRLVVAFGDSLYAGYQLDPKDGFAPQLQAALRKQGFAVSVLNAGVSGDTTAAGKARLNFVLDNAPQEVEMVILGLGGNDMLRGIRPEETRANITAMMDELKKRRIDVVLTGMIAAPNLGADYASKFNSIYPDLAKEYDTPLYPFFLDGVVTDSKLMLADGIHPNKQGVSKIVTGIEPVIASALKANE